MILHSKNAFKIIYNYFLKDFKLFLYANVKSNFFNKNYLDKFLNKFF